MRIDKEEKRSLKKLLVGVLVMALVIMMMPFHGAGNIEVNAAEIVTIPTENVYNISVKDMGGFQTALSTYEADAQNEVPEYANGVVITLEADLDFSTLEASINIPTGNVYIDLNGYNLYGCAWLGYTHQEGIFTDYMTQVHFSGTGGVYASGNADVLYVEDWQVPSQIQLTFSSDVDTSYIRFLVLPGASVLIAEETVTKDLTNALDSIYEYMIYNPKEGLYKYSVQNDMPLLYIEELGTNVANVKSFDVQQINTSSNIKDAIYYIYSKAAMTAIPEGVPLIYNGIQYENLNESLVVDSSKGLYFTSEDGKNMTIMALEDCGWGRYYPLDSTALFMITDNFFSMLGDGSSVQCKNVTFAAGAIDETYVNSSQQSLGVEGILIYPYNNDYAPASYERNFINFTFDFSNFTQKDTVNVYNRSGSAVNLENSIKTTVYVTNPVQYMELKNVTTNELETGFDGMDSYYYVKTGDILTLTPDEGYMLYDLQVGDWNCTYDETDPTIVYYSYDEGRRIDLEKYPITVNTDGSVEITIPNFTSYITAEVGSMEEDTECTSVDASIDFYFKDTETGIYYYDKIFDISAANGYSQICDLTDGQEGEWTASISESTEGEHSRTYYVIDQTTEQDVNDEDRDGSTDDFILSSTYGKMTYVTYDFVIDTESPKITSVTAIDAAGNTLNLNGDWYERGAPIPDPVWTNQESVTLTVNADKGKGVDIAEYEFDDIETIVETSNVYTSNVYTCSDDGVHELVIHVRDEFDKITGRVSAGVWLTTIGIDTITPTLMFTDVNNPTSTALKSDGVYEGNLHMVVVEDGSGFAELNLYRKDSNAWILDNESLIKTENGYYIAPTVEGEVYRIEVTDVAGNKGVYENLTLLGYEQDVAFTIGTATGVYGEGLEIPVTITNTSKNNVEITSLTLRKDATDSIFENTFESVKEIEAGGSVTTTLIIPKGTDAGNYEAMIDMAYTSVMDDASQCVAKVYSHQVKAVIEQAEGNGTIDISDANEGEALRVITASDANGIGNVTLYYKVADADDSTYSTTVPTAAGNYMVKAVFAATTNYKEAIATDTFVITSVLTDDSTSTETPSEPETLTPIIIQIQSEPIHLEKGISYKFEEGTWNVSGDTTNYAGGIIFYVSESGDYEFTKQ